MALFKAAATTVAALYMIPALFTLIQVAIHTEIRFGLPQVVAVITLLVSAAVILAHVTRKAWFYWPFMFYSVRVVLFCLSYSNNADSTISHSSLCSYPLSVWS